MNVQLPENPRILVTRTDRIGDLVVSTPIFQILRKKFPQAHLAACVFREHRELVQKNPFLNEVILYEKSGREKNGWGQFRFSQSIRKKKFDCVIHLHATNRMHLMGWMAQIPVRMGYDRRASWALTHVHAYDKKEGLKHESEYLSDLLSASGLSAQPASSVSSCSMPLPFVPVSAEMKLSVENLLQHYGVGGAQKFAVIHPSASDATKVWPAEKFAELIRECKGNSISHWIGIGGKEAIPMIKKISEYSLVPVINLCGQLSLGMLAALCEKAAVVISNDSGPAHIASAAGAPTVSIFGRWQAGLNAERWRPLGKKTAIVTPQIENVPESERKFSYIEDITTAQVLAAIKQVMA